MFKNKILVNIEATPNCPAACSMCPRSSIKDFGFMSLQTMERIVEQLSPDYVWEVDLAGRGEPTIHPQFYELLDIMKRPGILTDVTTTAVTFTERNVQACVDHVDVIRLSVSSVHKPTFDKVHIGLNFEKIWANIERLAQVAANKVIVHLTGGPVIYEHLPETVAHLRKLGYTRIYIFPLWNRGGDIETESQMAMRSRLIQELGINASESEYSSGGKLAFLTSYALGKLRNRTYCGVGAGSMSISFSGDILGCFQDFGHRSILGNIYKDDLRTIIKNRVKMLGKMEICQGCNANKAILLMPLLKGLPKAAQATSIFDR